MASTNTTLEMYHYPTSIPEACSLLRDDEGAKIIAGGTALALTKLQNVHALVDIMRLGLDYIKTENDGKHIGATTSAQTLANSVTLGQIAGGILTTAAAGIGSRPVRNQVTIGGNVVQLYPWSDLPAALIALDTTVKIAPEGRTVTVEEFVSNPPLRNLDRGELVTEFLVPAAVYGRVGTFIKFAKTHGDRTLADVAVTLAPAGGEAGLITDIRIVVSGVTRHPMRMREAEGVLKGKTPTAALINEAVSKINKGLQPRTDTRASVEYRRELTTVLSRRAIEHCVRNMPPGQGRGGG